MPPLRTVAGRPGRLRRPRHHSAYNDVWQLLMNGLRVAMIRGKSGARPAPQPG
jgi:hypothetical protein